MRTAFVASTLLVVGLSACAQSPDDRVARVIAGSEAVLDESGDSVVLGSGVAYSVQLSPARN